MTVAFTMTKRADQLHHYIAPAHSTALVQTFVAKHHISQVCQPPRTAQIWLPADSGFFFPKAKIPVEREVICECGGRAVHKLSQRRLTAD